MGKYFIELANLIFEINIEDAYKYYFNDVYSFFVCEKSIRNADIVINYRYVKPDVFEGMFSQITWKNAGIAELCGRENEKLLFCTNIYNQGDNIGKKCIVCSQNMREVDVYFNCHLLQDQFYLEMVIILNTLLSKENVGVILHCTGIKSIKKQKVYLFIGASGTGKSTIAKKIIENHSDYLVLSDDRIIVRKESGMYWAYGTPWVSAAQLCENNSGKIDKIFFIQHADCIHVEQECQVIQKFITNVFGFPVWDKHCSYNLLKYFRQLAQSVMIQKFGFSLESDIVHFINNL